MTEYDAARCVIGSKPHSADVGYLCARHLEQAGTTLREIEDQAALLTAVPSMQQRTGSRGGGLASEQTPVRLDVLVHNDPRHGTGKSEEEDDEIAAGDTLSILGTLHSWARIVREERDLTPPERVTISGERDLLSRHLLWAAAQDWVDEFHKDLRDLASQLKAQNGTGADRPYSTCPVIANGYPCGGDVWVRDELQPVWRRYPDRCSRTWEQAPGAAVCDTCGAAWVTDGDKARLKRMVADAADEFARPRTDDGRDMMTAAEIAARLGKTVNAVRIMATRAGVKAQNGHFDPQAFGLARHVA